MKRLLPYALVVVVLGVPGSAASQEPTDRVAEGSNQVVSASDRSAFLAGALEWYLPTAGYAYAGDWSRGIPPLLVTAAGVALLLDCAYWHDGSCEIGYLGALLVLQGRAWAVIDVVTTTKRENRRRRQGAERLVITPILGRDRAGLAMSLKVRW